MGIRQLNYGNDHVTLTGDTAELSEGGGCRLQARWAHCNAAPSRLQELAREFPQQCLKTNTE